MNPSLFSIGRILFDKNIAFCLYRFPGSATLNLAIEKGILVNKPQREFRVSPFVKASSAREFLLDVVGDENPLQELVEKLNTNPEASISWNSLPAKTSHEEYNIRINHFLKDIRAGKLQKAILSRVHKVRKPPGFDPFDSLEGMCTRHPEAFIYLLFQREAGMWMGATPELLLKKEGASYWTMALAGTQPANEERKYCWNEKERMEQQMVEQHIELVFQQSHSNLVKKNGPATRKAGKVVHLQTDYEFYGDDVIGLEKLLSNLHPTPAVGGLPADKGLDCIAKYEGYDREYYCGFLGETSNTDDCRLFINLRCMKIGENEIAIFCGGGITADSDPDAEWNETVQKSSTMLDTLLDIHQNEVVR